MARRTVVAMPGDGIGKVVLPEAVRVLGAVGFEADWVEAAGNYIRLHVGDEVHQLRATLGSTLEQLDPRTFVRIHRSAIVNVERIREVQPWFGGDYVAILRDGRQLRVSRHYRDDLLRPSA